jgi:hypothetical protein
VTLDEIRALIARGRQRGLDPMETLERLGLLLTDERHTQIIQDAFRELANVMEQVPVGRLDPGSHLQSFLDVKTAAISYIRRNFVKGSVE